MMKRSVVNQAKLLASGFCFTDTSTNDVHCFPDWENTMGQVRERKQLMEVLLLMEWVGSKGDHPIVI